MFTINDETKRLYSTFVAYRNDIDIYTEDEDKNREFYSTLFNRLLDKSIKVNEITPLGSGNNVIKMCKADIPNGRKKIFIIDGDIRLIHGDLPKYNNLFVLGAYCIENYLIDKESINKYIYISCGTKSLSLIKEEVDYEKLLNSYCKVFMDLFFHFSIIDLLNERFVLFNAYKFFNKGSFDSSLVINEIELLKERIINLIGYDKYEYLLNNLKAKWSYNLKNFLVIISGKDYLIPIVLMKTQEFRTSKALPSLEEVKIHFVHTCNLDRLDDLRNEIERIVKS